MHRCNGVPTDVIEMTICVHTEIAGVYLRPATSAGSEVAFVVRKTALEGLFATPVSINTVWPLIGSQTNHTDVGVCLCVTTYLYHMLYTCNKL